MAPKSKKLAKIGRKIKRVANRAVSVAKGFAGLDDNAKKAAMMLMDPCNAALEPGCYRGDQGFKARFVANGSLLTSATTVAGAVAFVPNSTQFYTIDWTAALPATAWTDNSTFYSPGRTFINANASGVRSLGACVSLAPLSSNLATAGVVYSGVVPVSSLGLSSTWTPPQLAQLLPNFGKVTIDGPMECKYIPASADENYTLVGQTGDASDNNAILFVFIGFPASTGFSVRATNIAEWKPLANLGIASNSALGNPSRNTIEHVKEALRMRDEHWYTNVGKTAFSVLRGYSMGGLVGAAGAALKVFK
jgi:hypothetical protein